MPCVRTSFKRLGIPIGREFVLLEYMIFFHPQHGSILRMYFYKIYHGTCRNIGYTQVGVAFTTKVKIANVGAKRQRNLKFE
jgi:hypothetical protein